MDGNGRGPHPVFLTEQNGPDTDYKAPSSLSSIAIVLYPYLGDLKPAQGPSVHSEG